VAFVRVRGRTAAGIGALALGTALAGCSGGGGAETASPPGARGGPGGTSSAPATHPFTGGRSGLDNPVLAVKVENTQPALPRAARPG
jgi:hypothetical protein